MTETDRIKFITGGFTNGKEVFLPSDENAATLFGRLFHEIGHVLDAQFDIKEILRPLAEIKRQTIVLSREEIFWIADQHRTGWQIKTGVTDVHRDILKKILPALLKDGTFPTYSVHSHTYEELTNMIIEKKLQPEGYDVNYQITNPRVHRSVETPADYILELCFDVLNRSIARAFNLDESFKLLIWQPDDSVKRPHNVAKYLVNKNWLVPGYLKEKWKDK